MIRVFGDSSGLTLTDPVSGAKYLSVSRYKSDANMVKNMIKVVDAQEIEHFIGEMDDAYIYLDGILNAYCIY